MSTRLFCNNPGNETYALFQLDLPDSLSGAESTWAIIPIRSFPLLSLTQYSALYAWRSIGHVELPRAWKSCCATIFSTACRRTSTTRIPSPSTGPPRQNDSPPPAANNYAQIINSWNPSQLRGVSDFDMTHQINANYFWELPVGRGRHWMSNSNRVCRRDSAAAGNSPVSCAGPADCRT